MFHTPFEGLFVFLNSALTKYTIANLLQKASLIFPFQVLHESRRYPSLK